MNIQYRHGTSVLRACVCVCVTRHSGGGKSLGATIVETKVDRAKSWTCCRGLEAVSSSRLTGNCPYLGRIKPARHVFVHFFTSCVFRNISDQVPTPAGIPCCFLEFFQPSFLIFFARYFPHGDEIFSSSLFSLFFLICRSPSFVCVFETTK